ncbi:MAG: choice-of-anchor tandem repeat GloVer-containing protein [Candidatus Cybelea sp.]
MKASILTSSVAAILLAGCAGSHSGSPLPDAQSYGPAAGPLGSSFQVLHVFKGSPHDGGMPDGSLISVKGTLYGTTSVGGRHCYDHGRSLGCGTVFSITPQGKYHLIYSFRGGPDDPSSPIGSLAEMGGTLYGASIFGGSCKMYDGGGCGTIFSVNPSGKERVVYTFKGGSDGVRPSGGLIAMNGTLYGVTSGGGGSRYCKGYSNHGCGTVFAVTASGEERVVYRFPVGAKDGSYPSGQLLALGGKLFGTTLFGGYFRHCGNGCGTIFEVTASGVGKVLYRFDRRSQGSQPEGLIAVNGLLYGTTFNGGVACGPYGYGGCGTVFEATAAGALRTIYTFKSISEGAEPQSLTAENGILYGTSRFGGNVCGVSGFYGGALFAITTSGKKQWTYQFPCSGGVIPGPGLLELGGLLYGTTSLGTEYGDGTIFTFSI